MPNRIEARPAKAALTNATGRLPLLRLFSTPLTMSVEAFPAKVNDCKRPFATLITVPASHYRDQ
jgi:hypothetical protein